MIPQEAKNTICAVVLADYKFFKDKLLNTKVVRSLYMEL